MRSLSLATAVVLGVVFAVEGYGNPKMVDTDKLVYRDGLLYEINSEEPFTGIAVTYYSTGELLKKAEYSDGKANGKEIWWNEDGTKQMEIGWQNDETDGNTVIWYPSGEKHQEIEYCNGEPQQKTVWWPNGQKKSECNHRDGVVTIRTWDEEGNLFGHTVWEEDGNLISLEVWDPDGNLIHDHGGQRVVGADKLLERDGLRYEINSEEPFMGIAVDYNPIDELQRETQYRDGVKNGKELVWNKDGTKSEEAEWRDGKENGKRICWYPSGEKHQEIDFCDGEIILHTAWRPNGKKEWECKWRDGKYIIVQKWDEEGKLIKDE